MSEISVHRTAGGGRCLVIDGTRVAGAKPEFSGDNCVCWWQTNETIGVVDDIEAENARLKTENEKQRELLQDMQMAFVHGNCYRWCRFKEPCDGDRCQYLERMRELGIEVGE